MANINECMGPLWNFKLWEEINTKKYLKHTNCYSYAFNYIDYGEEKLQPGEIHGTKYTENTCEEIIKKMKNDYFKEKIEKVNYEEKLKNDSYKIALFVDLDKKRKGTKEHDQDYHFYREDCNIGTNIRIWSHKPGTNYATNEDASGNVIYDPREADRNYKEKCKREKKKDCHDEHNYTEFCGFFSVPLNSKNGPVFRYIERE